MQQPTSNRFQKGLNSDLSLTDRPQDMYLDGHNIRIANRDEGTLWAANIKGNEETFQLREGFIPLGSVEFDGFLFIASVNPDNGVSEIGCYPSYTSTGTLVRSYNALQNFSPNDIDITVGDDCLIEDLGFLGSLTTINLNFQCEHPIKIIARSEYDGSVNLYFTDNFNPWRTVNSGFILSTGEKNKRFVTDNQILGGFINGINENENIPVVNLIQEISGGSLQVGNYFFFVRYTDVNFSATSFLGQSGPIPVFNTFSTSVNVPFGGEETATSDKLVELEISNLDTSSNFYEVAFIRYYGRDLFEVFLIDKRYSINSSTSVIRITGNEPKITLTLDELIVFKPSDALICKDLDQLDNQLYLANTKGPVLDNEDIREFMCKLKLREGYTNNGPADDIRSDTNNNPYSNDANDTEEKVGYFSGETYIFAAIPVFKGGFYGLPYPITGYDNYNGSLTNTNKNGVYRFSKAQINPYWDGTDTFIKSIKVDTTLAQPVYNNSQFLQDNLIGVVICRGKRNKILLYQGISLRCYNGRVNPRLQLYASENDRAFTEDRNKVTTIFDQDDTEDWVSDRFMPMFEPATYEMASLRESRTGVLIVGNYAYYHYAPPSNKEERNDFTEPNKLGIFSTDYFLDRVNVPDTAYVQMVGTTRYETDWKRESTAYNNPVINTNTNALQFYTGQIQGGPSFAVFEPDPSIDPLQNPIIADPLDIGHAPTFVGYNQKGITYDIDGFSSATRNIVGFDAVPKGGFTARFDEGRVASQDGLYYYKREVVLFNTSEYDISLPIATPDYIAIENAPSYAPTGGPTNYNHYSDRWDRAIVNVCRTNPAFVNYRDLYDFKNTEFFPISNYQEINSFLSQNEHEYFRGDCFVKRTYLKIANGSNENLGNDFIDVITGQVTGWDLVNNDGNFDEAPQTLLKGYGHWISLVTENAYNADYRHELGRNYFYPKTNVEDPGKEFAWLFDSPESYFYNGGYNNLLGPRAGVGIDLLQPVSNNRFPTRIRPSATHTFGAILDGYRLFIPADAKDFDYTFGDINAIVPNMDMLYSFQSRAINIHPVNERVTQQGDSGSTAILGESAGLTQFKTVVTDRYGCQHRFAVVKANAGVYCIDWNKRSMIRIAGNNLQVLDIEKGAQTWLRNIIANESSGYSDVLELLPDQHPCGKGIHSAYNVKFKEVVFTFRFEEESYTIAYSEIMDAFLGTHGYKPIHYAQVEEDLYSFVDNKGWLHDVNEEYDTFYGELDEWRVRYVVNEQANIANHWDSMIISSNNRRFKSVSFETQHQTALQDPFVNEAEFWYKPTYRENSWRLPIRRADNTKEPEENIYDDFTADKTPLRGRYLVVELIYNENKDLWVREVITSKTQSFT